MTNNQLLQLSRGLESCGQLKGTKFAYAIAKNNKLIQGTVEAISESVRNMQFDHAKKDKDKKPVLIGNQIEMKDLDKFNKEYKKLMAIENDIKLHIIKEEDLPADITAMQLSLIIDIVE